MNETGTIAGQVWQALKAESDQSLTKLVKKTGAKRDELAAAIGWLQREDKLIVATDPRGNPLFSLKETAL
ncbi:MAG: winged helix-turn-helix domain-containing protein [Lentisphaeria bacterium]|nr:winged helix-turn-helix domain-containing protein [Candidatus Neomarinimicrobiota bacterium]MCF7843200.1 winged helix-turn-helix domain-containing protein [Lentisphaeria bacterium]